MSSQTATPNRVPAGERRPRALVAYVRDDMTLQQIGGRFGVTREMIRQDLNRQDRTLFSLAKRRRQARTRLRRSLGRAVYHGVADCVVCGERFEKSQTRSKYCSPIHHQVEWLLKFHLRADQHDRQRKRNARRTLRTGYGSEVYAHNELAGTVDRRGRWLIVGSLPFHWSLRAYVLDWPLFHRLHPDLQGQIREHLHTGTRYIVPKAAVPAL